MRSAQPADSSRQKPSAVRHSEHDPLLTTPVYPAVNRLRTVAVVLCLAMLFVVIPGLNLAGIVADQEVNRAGRYLCFAIAALGMDLIWGYAGVLSLCHAFFFCLGGYAMAMHLSLPEGGGDVRPEYNHIPQFFFFNNVDTLPLFWKPFASLTIAALTAVLLPAGVAAVFGFFIFRSRVRGVYFAIITQAVAWGVFLAFCRNEMLLGGTNGLTNFYKPLNQASGWIIGLYLATAVTLVLTFLICIHITHSRLGRLLVAVRDNEPRLYFAGYRPHLFKVFAFSTGAALAAVGGALYAPQNGIITPNIMRVEDSILMVVCVALGGRGRLWGAVIGALVFNYAYSTMTTDMATAWPFILGAVVLLIVLLLPEGLMTLWNHLETQVAAGDRWWRLLLTTIPLAVMAFIVVNEALGLTPGLLQQRALGIHGKYHVLFVAVAVYTVMRSVVTGGHRTGGTSIGDRILRQIRTARGQPL